MERLSHNEIAFVCLFLLLFVISCSVTTTPHRSPERYPTFARLQKSSIDCTQYYHFHCLNITPTLSQRFAGNVALELPRFHRLAPHDQATVRALLATGGYGDELPRSVHYDEKCFAWWTLIPLVVVFVCMGVAALLWPLLMGEEGGGGAARGRLRTP